MPISEKSKLAVLKDKVKGVIKKTPYIAGKAVGAVGYVPEKLGGLASRLADDFARGAGDARSEMVKKPSFYASEDFKRVLDEKKKMAEYVAENKKATDIMKNARPLQRSKWLLPKK